MRKHPLGRSPTLGMHICIIECATVHIDETPRHENNIQIAISFGLSKFKSMGGAASDLVPINPPHLQIPSGTTLSQQQHEQWACGVKIAPWAPGKISNLRQIMVLDKLKVIKTPPKKELLGKKNKVLVMPFYVSEYYSLNDVPSSPPSRYVTPCYNKFLLFPVKVLKSAQALAKHSQPRARSSCAFRWEVSCLLVDIEPYGKRATWIFYHQITATSLTESCKIYAHDWLSSISDEVEIVSARGVSWPIAIYLLSRYAVSLRSHFDPLLSCDRKFQHRRTWAPTYLGNNS